MPDSDNTWILRPSGGVVQVPRLRATVVAGPDAGLVYEVLDGRLVLGTGEVAGLRLSDQSVSRFHVELEATTRGVRVRDLGSTNGTWLGPVRIGEILIVQTTEITLGRSRIRAEVAAEPAQVEAHRATSFGGLVGSSHAMRVLFGRLLKAARTDATVLVTGETGTGKEIVARSIHEASARQSGPLEIIDCGALPPSLVESELFGHVRGAFTGAARDHEGAFVRANGGTLFIDELGELPLELQPKLLRAIADRSVRPIGAKTPVTVDVRIVAATHRDLRQLVNQGRFRADLYYRLAVVLAHVPPLRDRLDDLPLLVPTLLEEIARERRLDASLRADHELLAELGRHDWPGNVRELRNYLERALVFDEAMPLAPEAADGSLRPEGRADADLLELPLRDAKARLTERFERRYLECLLEAAGGNVAEAARRSGVDRGTLFRMMRRHRVTGSPP